MIIIIIFLLDHRYIINHSTTKIIRTNFENFPEQLLCKTFTSSTAPVHAYKYCLHVNTLFLVEYASLSFAWLVWYGYLCWKTWKEESFSCTSMRCSLTFLPLLVLCICSLCYGRDQMKRYPLYILVQWSISIPLALCEKGPYSELSCSAFSRIQTE